VHPQPEEESIFRTFFAGHVRLYLDRLLRATTKKGQLFWQKKCTPQTKSWLRLWLQELYRLGAFFVHYTLVEI